MPMRHSTLGSDAWISCNTAANPNTARPGNSHWIRFNLGNIYALRKVTLWNYNHPDSLNMGIQSFYIDYKNENGLWLNLGTYSLNQAPGSSFYQGQNVADFLGKSVSEVLITGVTNYGGTCYGLSEARFDIANSALAVTIIDARLDCKTEQFKWNAKSEEDIQTYILQGSNDLENWVNIDQKEATKAKSYEMKSNRSQQYFRLKIMETSGVETFSKVVFNNCNFTSSELMVVPNPVVEFATLKVGDLSNLTGRINVFSEVGSMVRSWPKQTLKNEININLGDLPSGQYFIVLEHSENNKVIPVTKL